MIKDLQQQHARVFTVRLGEMTTNAKGTSFPTSLVDKMRVTSPNRSIVQAFSDVYGGPVTQWEDGWQVHLPQSWLPILLLPNSPIEQWWKKYRGSVCERRCDGVTEQLSKKPCMCNPDPEIRSGLANECNANTRVNFICPEVAVLGVGNLVTNSLIAAQTLPQAVAVVNWVGGGRPLAATLRAEQLSGKDANGKPSTFVVPRIEVTGASFNELTSGSVPSNVELQSGGVLAPLEPSGRDEPPTPATELSAPATPAALSPGIKIAPGSAPLALREQIAKQGTKAGLDLDGIEALVLEKTNKYIDEADFSIQDGNAVLEAIRELRAE